MLPDLSGCARQPELRGSVAALPARYRLRELYSSGKHRRDFSGVSDGARLALLPALSRIYRSSGAQLGCYRRENFKRGERLKGDAIEGVELFHAVWEEGSDKLDIKDLAASHWVLAKESSPAVNQVQGKG
jgi:hypothetical protein